jgi:hypothetical protein
MSRPSVKKTHELYRMGVDGEHIGWCCQECHRPFLAAVRPNLTFARYMAHRVRRHHMFLFRQILGTCNITVEHRTTAVRRHADHSTYYTVTVTAPSTWTPVGTITYGGRS